MQLVSRVPRGTDCERNDQLDDHRIYTLFGTCGQTRCGPPSDREDFSPVDDEDAIESHSKAYAREGKAVHAATNRNKRAKLEHLREYSADARESIDERHNDLMASVK
eukprot:5684750-Prymnesium_polylepis.1